MLKEAQGINADNALDEMGKSMDSYEVIISPKAID